jgi:hypothetical protein
MALNQYRVDFYNTNTNLLHSSYEVTAPSHESAVARARVRFGNSNGIEADPAFFAPGVTQLTFDDDTEPESAPETAEAAPSPASSMEVNGG